MKFFSLDKNRAGTMAGNAMNATMTDERLLLCLNAAHEASALLHNLIHEALLLATVGSGSYVQALDDQCERMWGPVPVVAPEQGEWPG